MFSQRFTRSSANGPGTAPPWLETIHAANAIEHIFGQPTFTGQREGVGYVEEYLDADVIFPADDPITVRIIAKTELGDRVLKQAVATQETPVSNPTAPQFFINDDGIELFFRTKGAARQYCEYADLKPSAITKRIMPEGAVFE